MRVASLKSSSSPDGELVVVAPDGKSGVRSKAFRSLLAALDRWPEAEPYLKELETRLERGDRDIEFEPSELSAPLPRTFSLLDGSAFIQHIILVRKARNAEPPEDLFTVPLMYQGAGDHLLGPTDPIPFYDESWGLDYEAEVCVVLDEVPLGTKAEDAERYIRFFILMNDISLRGLIPRELAAGFGFFHGKPASSFSPFAVTKEELGAAWRDGRVHLPMISKLNGEKLGDPDAGEMHFSFFQLIEHASKTRHLPAGTILGSGTVSNKDESRGVSCLAEKRTLETIASGSPTTPFLRDGDEIAIQLGEESRFGEIRQRVRAV